MGLLDTLRKIESEAPPSSPGGFAAARPVPKPAFDSKPNLLALARQVDSDTAATQPAAMPAPPAPEAFTGLLAGAPSTGAQPVPWAARIAEAGRSAPPAPGIPDDWPQRLGNAGNAFVQGASGILSDTVRGVSLRGTRENEYLTGLLDRIDRGENVPAREAMGLSEIGTQGLIAYKMADPAERARLRAGRLSYLTTPPTQDEVYRAGTAVETATQKAFPTDPKYQGEFLTDTVPRGAGSTAGFAVAGAATRGGSFMPLVGAGITGSLVQSSQSFQDALAHGASIEDAYKASDLGGVVGLSEAVPIARLFDRFDKGTGGTFRRGLTEALKGGTEESLQEFAQQTANNLIASGIVKFDPERGTFEGVGEASGAGFTIGSLYSFIASMAGAKLRSRTRAPALPEATPPDATTAPQGLPETGLEGIGGIGRPTPEQAAPAPDLSVPVGDQTVTFLDPLHRAVFDIGQRLDAGEQIPDEALQPVWEALRPYGVTEPGFSSLDTLEDFREYARTAYGDVQEELRTGKPVVEYGSHIDPDEWPGYTRQGAGKTAFGGGTVPASQPAPAGVATAQPAPAQPQPAAPQPTAPAFVVTPAGRRVEVMPEVVEADSLVTSQTDDMASNPAFPAALQPRDRSRAASTAQIADIAGNLNPDLLGASTSAAEGAPIVGPDGVVESGNGRTLAIRLAYARSLPGAQAYREWLKGQGYNVEGLRNPVLVRRRTTDLSPEDRQAFVNEANQRTTLSQSASEQATNDAKAIPGWLLAEYRGGEVGSAANRDFVRKFLDAVVPQADRAALQTAEGAISQEGLRRIQNALFARAFEDPELIAALREDQDSNVKGIGDALIEASPAWAQMRRDAELGDIPASLDITYAVQEAVRLVRRARGGGTPIADVVDQTDLISGSTDDTVRGVLRLMFSDANYRRPVSKQKLSDALRFYAGEAMKAKAGPSLLGDTVTGSQILQTAIGRRDGDLFGDAAQAVLPDTAAMGGESLLDRINRIDAEARGKADILAQQEPSRLEGIKARARALGGSTGDDAGSVLPDTAQMQPGQNYVGLRQGKVAGTSSDKPIRREDILRPLLKALGVPLYQGRMKGRRILGFYRRGIEEVRIKNMSDIEVASHELAHMLDDRFPEIRAQWLPATNANKAVREELRGVSYDDTKLYEGFAEYVRLWATQTDKAKALAPKFHGWFEDWLTGNPHGPALRRAQGQMIAWFEQSGLDRARSKIGEVPGINEGLSGFWNRFRQYVTDDLAGIYNMERDLTGGIAPAGPYELARLTRAAYSILEGALIYGAPVVNSDGSHSYRGKSLQAILAPVTDRLDDFLMYAVGKSAAELRGQGREHLFDPAEIRAMENLETPAFKKAFAEYQDWNRAILDFAQAKNLISGQQRASWRRAAYLPFHRVGTPGNFSAVQGDWKGIKALTGGTDNLRDILGNIIGNAGMLIQASLVNEARLEVDKLSKESGGARFMAQIPTEDETVKVHKVELRRAMLEALGVTNIRQLPPEVQQVIDEIVDNLDAFVPLVIKGRAPRGGMVVAALHRGKPAYFEVIDPVLYRALTRLSRPRPHWFLRLIGWPRRIGQTTITLSLDFMGRNFVRDTLMSGIMSRTGFKPFKDSAVGLVSRVTTDQNYQDYIANGGGMASHLVDEESYRRHLSLFYQSKGINPSTVMNSARSFGRGLQIISESVEMSARLGEYKRAIEQGENPRHAAYLGREVSTDFTMRGDSDVLNWMYETVIFLRAAVVSWDRMYRGLADDPNRLRIAVKVGLLASASMGLALLNRGLPEYDDLEDWDRDANWHFFIPKPETLEAWSRGEAGPSEGERFHHFRIPKLWEVGAIASMAERTIERLLDGQPEELAADFWRVFKTTFGVEVMPQAVAPFFETATNRNRFTGSPIESQAMVDLEPWARFRPGGSRTMQAFGEAQRGLPTDLQMSPVQIEALLRGYFNAWTQYALMSSDAVLFDDTPDMRLDQYPGIRAFYQQSPARRSRYENELYDALKEATAARRTMRLMDRINRPDYAAEIENKPENREYRQLSRAAEKLRTFHAEATQVATITELPALQDYARRLESDRTLAPAIRRIRNSDDWWSIGGLKRGLLDMWTTERLKLAKDVVKDVEQQRVEQE
jgi:hypothetical protein